MWESSLKQFGGAHRVIAIDLPGLGQSEPSKNGYSAQALSEYLFAAIKKLTKEPIIYVSHDLSNTGFLSDGRHPPGLHPESCLHGFTDPGQGDVDLPRVYA